MSSGDIQLLIVRVRDGDRAALEQLFQVFHDQLSNAAKDEIPARLQARISPSDVVQRTLLSAFLHMGDFNGTCAGELLAWLQQIHKRNVVDEIRKHDRSGKRSIRREQSMHLETGGEPGLIDDNAAVPCEDLIRQEEVSMLLAALEMLPPDQREAVRLRQIERWTLERMSAHFGRSREATASLLKRGLENVRNHLPDPKRPESQS